MCLLHRRSFLNAFTYGSFHACSTVIMGLDVMSFDGLIWFCEFIKNVLNHGNLHIVSLWRSKTEIWEGIKDRKTKAASVQFSSVAQSCPTLCDPMNHSTPGLPVHHHLPDFTQTHVHRVGDAIQPSHPLTSPSPPTFNLSQHQGLSKWVSSSHQVAKVLEFQLQHQSFQWIFRTDFL